MQTLTYGHIPAMWLGTPVGQQELRLGGFAMGKAAFGPMELIKCLQQHLPRLSPTGFHCSFDGHRLPHPWELLLVLG